MDCPGTCYSYFYAPFDMMKPYNIRLVFKTPTWLHTLYVQSDMAHNISYFEVPLIIGS